MVWTTVPPTRHQVAIAGSVSDGETGQAIGKAEVKITASPAAFKRWLEMRALQFGDLSQQQVVWFDRTFGFVQEGERFNFLTYTALDGQFYFMDLVAGEYEIEVSLPAAGTRYGTATMSATVAIDKTGKISRAKTDIALPPTTIRGRVTDLKKNGVVMAKVQIMGSENVTFSDREGRYLLPELEVWTPPPGEINTQKPIVKVSAQGYESQAIGALLTRGKVTALDVVLARQPTPAIA
jgi:Carboxypeptidase regulatory-like domain